MLALKPHAFRVRSISETANGGVVYSAESVDYYGLLTPTSQTSVYQSWGLELKNPFVLYTENADAVGIQPGDRISISGRVFTVVGIERRDVNDVANHAKILLERLDYA